eukprot:CAMPEP_0206138026 /NCGR_PEP_ID=MMETSP1473-20131121/3014_1 /ASSEMBLY_ACC=CAM_ASM_001109 /TAXON_ID=1461547 /ORGANISM="Stichococcus sp, Strain RCC1054" /LENGTH=109 /DNA_ID=CAMNT_0053531329 /DNA_START=1759 /DNA_END=2086 /DNA_ORIENTATION=-
MSLRAQASRCLCMRSGGEESAPEWYSAHAGWAAPHVRSRGRPLTPPQAAEALDSSCSIFEQDVYDRRPDVRGQAEQYHLVTLAGAGVLAPGQCQMVAPSACQLLASLNT